MTEAGSKAVASHTGALAGSNAVWSSLFHQLGVIQAYDLTELIDMTLLFQHLKPFQGRGIGLVGVGGGFSVTATDSCESNGLTVPSLPPELRRRLREIIPEEADPGTSVRNPIDLSGSGWNPEIFSKSIETVANYDGIDFIIAYTAVSFGLYRGANTMVDNQINALIHIKEGLSKPLALVIRHSGEPEAANYAFDVQGKCLSAGIPVFSSFEEAASSISKFSQYYRNRKE